MIVPLRRRRINGIRDIIDGAKVRRVERGTDALRVGRVELRLPRGDRALAFDVVQETAAPGSAALVGGHGGVDDVDAPFNVAGGTFGNALAGTGSWDRVGGLGGRCCECGCDEGGDEEGGEFSCEWRHDGCCFGCKDESGLLLVGNGVIDIGNTCEWFVNGF